MRHIERKEDLKKLLKKMDKLEKEKGSENLNEFDYWHLVVEGCIKEDLPMDEVDYENAPRWFRPLWTGLR